MKYGWHIAVALLGLVAVWELLKAHKAATASPAAVGSNLSSYVGIVTPTNPTGAFSGGLSQNPFDPNLPI